MPRPQFTLRALLVAVLVVALGANRWRMERQAVVVARDEFEMVMARHLRGRASIDDLRDASAAILKAELAVPFSRDRTAWLSHLERTRDLEGRSRGFAITGSMPSAAWIQHLLRTHDELSEECRTIEQQLGLSAD